MAVTLDWDSAKPAEWDRLMTAIPRSTLEQSWAYGAAAAAAQGHAVRRAVLRRGREPVGLVQVLEKPLLGPIRIAEILRGPLFLPGTDAAARRDGLAAIRAALRLRERRLLLWMPEMVGASDEVPALRALGLRPVLTGYSSVWIDLSRPAARLRAAPDAKWRNALRNAERSRLKAQVSRGGRALDWLAEHHDAFRRARRFRAPSGALVKAFAAHATIDEPALHAFETYGPARGAAAWTLPCDR